MTIFNDLILGYDIDMWENNGVKIPISTDISPQNNSHILLCGQSGSGKSYAEHVLLARIIQGNKCGIIYFSDYKGDDTFSYLKDCKNYFSFKDTLKALDIVYNILNERLAGRTDRTPVTLIWDEYVANILALTNEDKKQAAQVMNKVSEILLMGRSMGVRLLCSCQRPDAVVFPVGSRLNYGVVIILGAYIRSIYEMLMPDCKEMVEGRQLSRGEGTVLLQGSELHFLKVPSIRNPERMKELCLEALS